VRLKAAGTNRKRLQAAEKIFSRASAASAACSRVPKNPDEELSLILTEQRSLCFGFESKGMHVV
jgi:hypothetical protein